MLLDIIFCTLLLIGTYLGLKRGFILELFFFIAIALAGIASIYFTPKISVIFFQKWSLNPTIIYYSLVIIISLVAICCIMMIGKLLSKILHLLLFGPIDAILGSLLGCIKWILYISFSLYLADIYAINIPESYTNSSKLYPFVEACIPKLLQWWHSNKLPIYSEMYNYLNSLKNH